MDIAEPKIIKPEDVDPMHNWRGAIPAPGHTAVDFEERVDFRRLHNYRLACARQALKNSELGALFVLRQQQHSLHHQHQHRRMGARTRFARLRAARWG